MVTGTKKLLALLVVTGATAVPAHSQVLEQFDYPAGGLDTLNGGSGWVGPWTVQGSLNGAVWSVATPGLDSLLIDGETGGAAFSPQDTGTTIQGVRISRELDQTYSSGTVFLSFLMQQSDNTVSDPFTAIELSTDANTDNPNRVFSIGQLRGADGNGVANNQFSAESAFNGGVTDLEAAFAPFDTALNLYVTRFDLDNDFVEIFFNPDATTDLSGVGDASLTLDSSLSFSHLGITNFIGTNAALIDEIRVDTSAPVLLSASGPAIPGDVDNSGTVDIVDFNIIRDNFRSPVGSFMLGDLTGMSGERDGFVDFYDFIEWSAAFENAGGNLALFDLSLTPTPEPASGTSLLMLLAASGAFARNRR